MNSVCKVKNFSLSFVQDKKEYAAVRDVNMEIAPGEIVALIGESGCGKSVTALSMIGLQPENARVSGSIRFGDEDLLIADEPTTALDVTIQAQIMDLMKKMNRERQTAVLLISHDLGVIRDLCSRVYIMYAGRVVESGPVEYVLKEPVHPYTRGLAAAIPSAGRRGRELESIPGTVEPLQRRSKKGCPFAGRCFGAQSLCHEETPHSYSYRGRDVYCHLSPAEIEKRSAERKADHE